jgi:hypothetical protein
MPVDVSTLRRSVEAETGLAGHRATRPMALRRLSPMRAAAASLLVGGLVVALIVASSGGPVLASPDRLADLHQSLVAGDSHARQTVRSVAEANAYLASHNPGGPSVPGVPDDHVMACCLHALGRAKVSCVTLTTDGGVPISLAVADAAEVKSPASAQTTVADGVTYNLQSARGVQMVMSKRNGRFVCLMGKVPTERLIELARSLRF